MLLTWCSAVFVLMNSRAAISGFESPSPSRASTSRSRLVSRRRAFGPVRAVRIEGGRVRTEQATLQGTVVTVSEPTEGVHNDLRARYQRGDPQVVEAMARFGELTVEAREAILAGDSGRLGKLIDANFDLRCSICRIAEKHREMVRRARRAGATAKFAGSGGAIIGLCPDQATFERLKAELEPIRCNVFRPVI